MGGANTGGGAIGAIVAITGLGLWSSAAPLAASTPIPIRPPKRIFPANPAARLIASIRSVADVCPARGPAGRTGGAIVPVVLLIQILNRGKSHMPTTITPYLFLAFGSA